MESVKYASLARSPPSRRAGMLGKQLNSPLLTIDSAAQFCYCKANLAAGSSSIPLSIIKFSSRFSPNVAKATWTSNLSIKHWILHSTAQIENIITSNEDQSMWEACRQTLSAFNFSVEEKDKMLGKAFGFVHSPYWGEERKMEVPKFETVSGILDYLRSLNLSDDDLSKLLKKFPEVLGCNLEEELKANERSWRSSGVLMENLLGTSSFEIQKFWVIMLIVRETVWHNALDAGFVSR